MDPPILEELRDRPGGIAFVVVVAEHDDDRHIDALQLADESFDLLRTAVRREVADQGEHVGIAIRFREDLAQRAGRGAVEVHVAEHGDAQSSSVGLLDFTGQCAHCGAPIHRC